MKRILLTLTILAVFGSLLAQTGNNPFAKLGYKKHIMYTSSKGEFEEFHDMDDVVEIGSALFNTKTNQIVGFINEQQEETEVASATAAMSIDPLCEKYYWITPYAFCINNPINVIDLDGREGIVISGSPGDHENRLHFLINGLDRAKAAQGRAEKGEGTTWLIYNDKEKGFNQKDLGKYTALAQEAGINVQVVSEVGDIVDYINDKTGGDSRSNDQISSFYYVGHSTPGDLDVGYAGTGQNFDPSDLNSSAFKSDAWVNVVGGCNTAIDHTKLFNFIPTPFTFEKSIIRQFADILDKKSTIHGSNVTVFYPGGVARDQKLLEKNNGKIITIHGNRK